MRKLLLALLLLVPTTTYAQKLKLQGVASQSNVVVTLGTSSSTKALRTFPGCTVTILIGGTSTPATVWSDEGGVSPRANPQTADLNANWFGFLDAGTYDVRFSGTGVPSTFTLSGFQLGVGGGGGGGGVTSISGTPNQVIASAPTGAVALSLPQSIDTAATVQFLRVTASEYTAQGFYKWLETSNPTNSTTGTARIYMDNSTKLLRGSVNGGNYGTFLFGSATFGPNVIPKSTVDGVSFLGPSSMDDNGSRVRVQSNLDVTGIVSAPFLTVPVSFGSSNVTRFSTPADGQLMLRGSGTSFNRLTFGSSGPYISIDSEFNFSNTIDVGEGDVKATVFRLGGGASSAIFSSTDSTITLANAAADNFNRLCLGGCTSSFPAIKRNATALNFRLGDDSAAADITAGAVSGSRMVVTGMTGSGYLQLAKQSSDPTPAPGVKAFVDNNGDLSFVSNANGEFPFRFTDSSLSASRTYTLPDASGTIALTSTMPTPGGSSGRIQYNNGGAFGGVGNVTTDGSNITSLSLSSSAPIIFDTRARITSALDSGGQSGNLSLFNGLGTSFSKLLFGCETSGCPAIKRDSSTALHFTTADGLSFVDIRAEGITGAAITGTTVTSSGSSSHIEVGARSTNPLPDGNNVRLFTNVDRFFSVQSNLSNSGFAYSFAEALSADRTFELQDAPTILGNVYPKLTVNYNGSQSLDYAQASANTCETLTMALSGAASGDVIALGVPHALANHNTTATFFGWASAADTVSVRRCVIGADISNPAAAVIQARKLF